MLIVMKQMLNDVDILTSECHLFRLLFLIFMLVVMKECVVSFLFIFCVICVFDSTDDFRIHEICKQINRAELILSNQDARTYINIAVVHFVLKSCGINGVFCTQL